MVYAYHSEQLVNPTRNGTPPSDRELPEVTGWMVPRSLIPSSDRPDSITAVNDRTGAWFSDDFTGFPDPVREAESVLFLPAGLRISLEGWIELRTQNNTHVNWLALDPRSADPRLCGVQLLSDWVRAIDPGDSRRSAGRWLGVLHLRRRWIPSWENALRQSSDPAGSLGRFIHSSGAKIRPGWVREGSWSWKR